MDNGKDIWIGDGYSLSKDYLEKYSKLVIKVCKESVSIFLNKYNLLNYMRDEMEGKILDIIIEKTGVIFYNFGDDEQLLENLLISYCYKSCYQYLDNFNNVNIDKFDYKLSTYDNYEDNNIKEMDSFANIDMGIFEEEFLNKMNYLLSIGDMNYINTLKEIFCLNDNQYEEILENIKVKILKNN